MKTCTKCGETKPHAGFYRRNYDGVNGFMSECKACNSTRRRSAEAEARHEQAARDWYWDNKSQRQQYVVENRDRFRHYNAKRRSQKKGTFVEDVHPLVVLERRDGICGICGDDVDPLRFDVDHIVPLARGGEHSYRNTQPAHPRCNQHKGAKAPERKVA